MATGLKVEIKAEKVFSKNVFMNCLQITIILTQARFSDFQIQFEIITR